MRGLDQAVTTLACIYSQSPQSLPPRPRPTNPFPTPLFFIFSNSLAGCIACKVTKRVILARDHRVRRRLLGKSPHLLCTRWKKKPRKASEMRSGSRFQRSNPNNFHVGSVSGHRNLTLDPGHPAEVLGRPVLSSRPGRA